MIIDQDKHSEQAILPAYAAAIALGRAPESLYPEVAAHLRSCSACRGELQELLDLVVPAYTAQLEVVPLCPCPDLSFLPQPSPAPASKPWLIDEFGRLVITFTELLLDTLRQPSLVGASRGQLLYRYIQEPQTLQNMHVTIEVFAEDLARTVGRVRVGIDVPGHDPLDQAGSQVALYLADAVLRSETDDSGCVDFVPVPLNMLPHLRVEISAKP